MVLASCQKLKQLQIIPSIDPKEKKGKGKEKQVATKIKEEGNLSAPGYMQEEGYTIKGASNIRETGSKEKKRSGGNTSN